MSPQKPQGSSLCPVSALQTSAPVDKDADTDRVSDSLLYNFLRYELHLA